MTMINLINSIPYGNLCYFLGSYCLWSKEGSCTGVVDKGSVAIVLDRDEGAVEDLIRVVASDQIGYVGEYCRVILIDNDLEHIPQMNESNDSSSSSTLEIHCKKNVMVTADKDKKHS